MGDSGFAHVPEQCYRHRGRRRRGRVSANRRTSKPVARRTGAAMSDTLERELR